MSNSQLSQLLATIEKLRDPKTNSDWDQAQTFESIVPHTIEEAYEVADTIEQGNLAALKGEVADLLYQVIYYAQLAKEQELFDFDDVVASLNDKIINRKGHILAGQPAQANWEQRKRQEQTQSDQSMLADIHANLPALSHANKIQKRVASVGFDWPSIDGAIEKVEEEVLEVKEAVEHDPHSDHSAEEVGDLLFAVVNVARHMRQDPEQLLRKASDKFTKRFEAVEQYLAQQEVKIEDASLTQMEAAWQAIKKQP